MIRFTTAICMLLAAGSGLYLYQQKHRTQVLDRQIMATVNATILAQKRSHVLSAEWDLANDPERLAKLADQFLHLRTMAPSQFAALGDLSGRLPTARAADWKAEQTTEEPAEGEPVAETPLPIPPLLAPPPSASPAAAQTTTAARPPAAAAAGTGAVAARPSIPPGTSPSSPSPGPRPTATAAATPSQAGVARAQNVSARVSGDLPSSAQFGGHQGGSALGMARGTSTVPAPVPISAPSSAAAYGGN